MLITVIGTSTPLAYWGFALVRAVAQVLYGDIHHIHCLSLDDFVDGLSARSGRHVVFTSDIPDPLLSEQIIKANLPVIAFLDRPEDAVAIAIDSRGLDLKHGLVFSTLCFCALSELLTVPGTMIFRDDTYSAAVRDVVEDVLRFLGVPSDHATADEVMRRIFNGDHAERTMTVAEHAAGAGPVGEAFRRLSPSVQTIIARTCEPYRDVFAGKSIERLEWFSELFHTTNLGSRAGGYVDLVGPGRFIFWGPYLYLPRGDWIARIEFEVAENFSGNLLHIDVVSAQNSLAFAKANLPVEGVFAATLAFTIADLASGVEVRVHLYHGAIEGEFLLRSVRITRASARAEDRTLLRIDERPV